MMEKNIQIPWPGWEVVEKIGEGSFGSVYKLKHSLIHGEEYAALKVISVPWNKSSIKSMRAEGMDDESIAKSIKDEAESVLEEYKNLQELQGTPNIMHCNMVHFEPHSDGIGYDIYILMELLTPLLDQYEKLMGVEAQIIRFGTEICSALIACENKGVLHRDIKPENAFVSKDGVYKLGDFGIARSMDHTTHATQGVGTPSYMAPEVDKGEKYSRQADIYSLGITMYTLLNEGRIPFLPLPPKAITHADRQLALKRRRDGEQIPAPKNGSKELQKIVLKACAFDPKYRYASAKEMREDLQRLSSKDSSVSDYARVEKPKSVQASGLSDDVTVGPSFIRNVIHTPESQEDTVGPTFNRQTPTVNTARSATIVSDFLDKLNKFRQKKWDTRSVLVGAACCTAVILLAFGLLRGVSSSRQNVTHQVQAKPATSNSTVSNTSASSGCSEHKWKAATCSAPKTCSLCGATTGSPLQHKWEAATCSAPKTCSLCGETTGSALKHKWTSNSCTERQVCSLCGEKTSAKGHSWDRTSSKMIRVCDSCGESSTPSAFSFNDQLEYVKDMYYSIQDMEAGGLLHKVEERSGCYASYDESGELCKVTVVKGTSGIGNHSNSFSREYFYSDGELLFAFYSGAERHRFYFYKGRMFRWKSTSANGKDQYMDLVFDSKYLAWEDTILEEALSFLK